MAAKRRLPKPKAPTPLESTYYEASDKLIRQVQKLSDGTIRQRMYRQVTDNDPFSWGEWYPQDQQYVDRMVSFNLFKEVENNGQF